jgi:hypothetical protein
MQTKQAAMRVAAANVAAYNNRVPADVVPLLIEGATAIELIADDYDV